MYQRVSKVEFRGEGRENDRERPMAKAGNGPKEEREKGGEGGSGRFTSSLAPAPELVPS